MQDCKPKIALIVVSLLIASPSALANETETRCGWFENPTPGNAWLIDRHGEWTVGLQGGYQAEGDWPSFSNSQWVKTNVHYGYGCACMKVVADHASKRILKIVSAKAKPLSACHSDTSLPSR